MGDPLYAACSTADGPLNQRPWYAVQTRSRHEKMVEGQLQGKQIVTFLPTLSEVHHWSDRRREVRIPAFPSYIFVQISQSVEQRLAVLKTSGVVRLVGSGNAAVPIPAKQIEDIRLLLAQPCRTTTYALLHVGQRVRVRGGCLDGVEGILATEPTDAKLIISVECINRSISVQIQGFQVEPV